MQQMSLEGDVAHSSHHSQPPKDFSTYLQLLQACILNNSFNQKQNATLKNFTFIAPGVICAWAIGLLHDIPL